MCGSERSGPVGREGPDCDEAAPWAVQVKRAPRPQLPGAWLEQARRDARRDAQGRPWVLVQCWYRPGRPRVFIATCELDLISAYSNRGRWGATMRRHVRRPRLAAADLEALLRHEAQPWLLIQVPAGMPALASLDYRVLCTLGQHAAALTSRRPSTEEGP